MLKVGIVTNKGRIEAKEFDTLDKCYNYILSFDGEEEVTKFRILKDNIPIETEQGKLE